MISVIIPTLKPGENLRKTLEGLSLQNISKEIQVIVVGNLKLPSPYLFNEFKGVFGDLKFFKTGEKGANVARNFGLRFSCGEKIYFLDDDCIIPRVNHLDDMAKKLDQLPPEIFALGGNYLLPPGTNKINQTYFHISNEWLRTSIYESEIGLSHNLVGGNTLYKREAFISGINFDSLLDFGGTETTLNESIKRMGGKLVLNFSFPVVHNQNVGLYQFLRKAYKQGKGKAFNTEKYKTVKNFAEYNLESNFYLELYNRFFSLGRDSLGKFQSSSFAPALKAISFLQEVTTTFFYRFCYKQIIEPIYYILHGLLPRLWLRFYYGFLHRVLCKIYYMSEYHWKTYIKPIWVFLKSRLFGG